MNNLNGYFVVILIGFVTSYSLTDAFESCNNVNGRNFTELNGVWKVHNQSTINQEYLIDICNGLSQPAACNGSAICLNLQGDYLSLANFSKSPIIHSTSANSIGFYLDYNSTILCKIVAGHRYFYRSSITFECGRTLGSPVVIFADNCTVDFLWESSRACLHHPTDALKEVRCYEYDSNGKKRDLEYLVKQTGAYFVKDPFAIRTSEVSSDDGVYINVCRNIQTNSLHNCPSEAAACLIKNNIAYLLGTPTSGVNITDDNRLFLEYLAPSGTTVPTECSGFTPRVLITFVCPAIGEGGSKLPIVTSSVNCQYNIQWWTEAACPTDNITSNTCVLNVQDHGIALDLKPLTRKTKPYHVETTPPFSTKFYINVCGPTNIACGENQEKDHNAVCQITDQNKDGLVAGDVSFMKLKYYDNQLSLTYSNGDRCKSNGYRRTSFILFHCNESAGFGEPTFNHELHCNYYFDWETKYACVSTPSCQLTDDAGQTYDLSSLTKVSDSASGNWQVLNTQDTDHSYYLNVCGDLVQDDHTSSCPHGSSVCSVSHVTTTPTFTSFGSFSNSSLTRQANKLVLTYSSGTGCSQNGGKQNTTILFYCKMGDLESSPVLKYKSNDGCQLILTWHTAAACPLKSVNGTNCMVSDEESGLTFDLQRLKKTGSDAYRITTSSYDFYLNVCGDLPNSLCSSPGRHVAACQHEQQGENRSFVLGETSDQLLYYNGFVKLLYTHGDPYRDKLHNRSIQISFLCDPKKGGGSPEYVKEANHSYVFNWYTSYVCPFSSTQCMVETDGKQYDLSSLAKSEDDQDANWSVLGEEIPGKGRRKYYLNVCRPVNEVRSSTNHDVGCDALAGACETLITTTGKETISVASLGRPTAGPQIESGGGKLLSLTYSNGDNCSEDGVAKKFKTIIHFSCRTGALSSSPRFLERTTCFVSFEWETEAACVVTTDRGKESDTLCEVKSKNSQYVFNLEPLKRDPNDPYTVSTNSGYTYELNICGNVGECKQSSDDSFYSGCRKNSSPSFDQKVFNHTSPAYSDDGRLTITYMSKRLPSGDRPDYEISFMCNRSVVKGVPVLSRIDGIHTRFDFQTSLACEPQAVDCLVADNFGNQYDLSPLSNPDHPWLVVDSSHSRRFYLGVCRPLPPVYGCSGGASGACMVKNDSGHVISSSLGLIRSNPQAVSNGGQSSDVSIVYTGGSPCGNDTTRRYLTRILFQCSEVEGAAPVLQTENSDPCEYFFVWRTPVACPIKRSVTENGQACSVVDPLYQMTFNLSSLIKHNQDYIVSVDTDWNFNLNICGKLNHATGSCKNSGSCQISKNNPNSMHDAGKPNATLLYEDGVVTLQYFGGQPCHSNRYNRSTVFRFTCHHNDSLSPTFINESADCTYLFEWPTPKVCPPVNVVECLAQDNNGVQYDLTSLSLPNNNHMVATRGETGKIYYVNICRSLLHKPGVTCPPNSAACFRTADKKFYSLGQVTSAPQIVDGNIVLTYTNGDVCLSDKARNYSTKVHFQCDSTAAIDSSPVMTSDSDSCEVELLWITRAACAPTNQPSTNNQPCTAVNKKSGHLFNLTSLADPNYIEVRAEDGRIFHINVCSPVVDSNCPNNTGNCITQGHSHYSAGEVSNKLTYQEGALALSYNRGAECTGQKSYSTVISFVCHRSPGAALHEPLNAASKPVFIGDDPDSCTHYFSWHTHLACELQTPCRVVKMTSNRVPHIIDMSPLISESGHYSALSDVSGKKAAYYINVCRPLEPIQGVHCPPGSAACEITSGHVAKTLGYIDPMENFLSYDSHSDTVTLLYKSNRTCETATNSSITVSTRIIFSCLQDSSSTISSVPILTTVTSDCQYVFQWGTELLCPAQKPFVSANNCSFHDVAAGLTYDLSKIADVTFKNSLGTFTLKPCSSGISNVSECIDSPLCLQSPNLQTSSLGKASTRILSSGATMKAPVLMTFTNGSKCRNSDKRMQVKIVFRCDQQLSAVSANKLTFFYDKDDPCEYTIVWPTSHVCPLPSESCVVIDSSTGLTYDLSLLSSVSKSWSFTDPDGNRYYINVCRPLPSRNTLTSHCDENATVCRITKQDRKAQSFGIWRSQEMSVTSKGVNVHYRGGDRNLCKDQYMSASTSISFVCDKSIAASPKFKSLSQEDCTLFVTWNTRIACPDEITQVRLDKNGKFVDPKSGSTIDLSPLMNKTYFTEGDLRQDKQGPTLYHYAISLSGTLDTTHLGLSASRTCAGNTTVCQYKPKENFARSIAETSSTSPTYIMTDESLEMNFTSTDKCGKDPNKTSHVFIYLRCSLYNGPGKPTFIYESNECGYFFQWYTDVMCANIFQKTNSEQSSTMSSKSTFQTIISNKNTHEGADRHNQSAAVVVGVLVGLLVFAFMLFILRNPRGRMAASNLIKKMFCCSGSSQPSYRFIPSGGFNDEGTSLFDDDEGGVLREETSLLESTARDFQSNHSNRAVDVAPITSTFDSELENDLFEIPKVLVASNGAKKKLDHNGRKKTKRSSSNRTEAAAVESDDLLSFIKPTVNSRSPGVGGEKPFHGDDDDVMLLDA